VVLLSKLHVHIVLSNGEGGGGGELLVVDGEGGGGELPVMCGEGGGGGGGELLGNFVLDSSFTCSLPGVHN
jgi:hypothetical protein